MNKLNEVVSCLLRFFYCKNCFVEITSLTIYNFKFFDYLLSILDKKSYIIEFYNELFTIPIMFLVFHMISFVHNIFF